MIEDLSNKMQLFIVSPDMGSNVKVVVWALGREDAKRRTQHRLSFQDPYQQGALQPNPDKYIVTPVTNPGDRVHLSVTLNT